MPEGAFTLEMAYHGSGNRNLAVGDSIFHCHFYPHFAQGMWYMWRNHDVFEAGTRLAISETHSDYHENIFGLMDGTPAELDTYRRLEENGDLTCRVVVPLWQQPDTTPAEMRDGRQSG